MNDTLKNILALVAEGRLSRAQAKGAAASAWLTGAVHADELPLFAIKLHNACEEIEDQKYAERKAKEMRDAWLSQWPEMKVWLEPRPTPPVDTFSIPSSGRREVFHIQGDWHPDVGEKEGWYVNGSLTSPFVYDNGPIDWSAIDNWPAVMAPKKKPAPAARTKKRPTRAAQRSSSRAKSKAGAPKSR